MTIRPLCNHTDPLGVSLSTFSHLRSTLLLTLYVQFSVNAMPGNFAGNLLCLQYIVLNVK